MSTIRISLDPNAAALPEHVALLNGMDLTKETNANTKKQIFSMYLDAVGNKPSNSLNNKVGTVYKNLLSKDESNLLKVKAFTGKGSTKDKYSIRVETNEKRKRSDTSSSSSSSGAKLKLNSSKKSKIKHKKSSKKLSSKKEKVVILSTSESSSEEDKDYKNSQEFAQDIDSSLDSDSSEEDEELQAKYDTVLNQRNIAVEKYKRLRDKLKTCKNLAKKLSRVFEIVEEEE